MIPSTVRGTWYVVRNRTQGYPHVLLLLFYEFCEEQKNEDAGVGTITVVHTHGTVNHKYHYKKTLHVTGYTRT